MPGHPGVQCRSQFSLSQQILLLLCIAPVALVSTARDQSKSWSNLPPISPSGWNYPVWLQMHFIGWHDIDIGRNRENPLHKKTARSPREAYVLDLAKQRQWKQCATAREGETKIWCWCSKRKGLCIRGTVPRVMIYWNLVHMIMRGVCNSRLMLGVQSYKIIQDMNIRTNRIDHEAAIIE